MKILRDRLGENSVENALFCRARDRISVFFHIFVLVTVLEDVGPEELF